MYWLVVCADHQEQMWPSSTLNVRTADCIGHKWNKIACGDFNVALANPLRLRGRTEFINSLCGNGLGPVVNKPRRITSETATLMDNIFTHRTEEEIVGGLFVCDISDHLPVSTVLKNVFK